MIDYSKYAEIKVVQGSVPVGWELLEVRNETAINIVPNYPIGVTQPREDKYGNMTYGGACTYDMPMPFNKIAFVIGKKHEDLLAQAKEDVISLRRDNLTLKTEKESLFEESSKKIKRLEDDLKTTQFRARDFADSHLAGVDKIKLMESDLVKLRNAIGELKFNEIVGEKK